MISADARLDGHGRRDKMVIARFPIVDHQSTSGQLVQGVS